MGLGDLNRDSLEKARLFPCPQIGRILFLRAFYGRVAQLVRASAS